MESQEAPGLVARRLAVQALERVEREGAYLSLALRALLVRRRASPAQAAAATALATGVMRWMSRLDYALGRVSRRPRTSVDPTLWQILRVAAYEIGFSRDTPAPVAVDLAVRQARTLGQGPAAFANAVLRALVREAAGGGLPAPTDGPLDARLAVTHSHPRWLVRRWLDRFGTGTTEAILQANNEPLPLSVRVNPLRATPERLQEAWRARGVRAHPTTLVPGGLWLEGVPGAVESLPGFEEGWFTPQSEAAMLVGHVAGARAGEQAVDLCAAPGGKTTHLAESSGDQARIVAIDTHAARLGLVRRNARRLGLRSIRTLLADATRVPLEPGRFDLVLLDAPCTALGTLARHPDVRWRRRPEDIETMARLQRELLEEAVELLRPGGRLVYSVCSFEPEETVDHARRLSSDTRLEMVPIRLPQGLAGLEDPELETETAVGLTLLPHRCRTDGFFVVRFDRSRAH